MRHLALLLATLTLALTFGCASGVKPQIRIIEEFDPLANVTIGPISYVTPLGVRASVYDRNIAKNDFLAHPDIDTYVGWYQFPPRDLGLDADRLIRQIMTRNLRGGSIRSTQYAMRGTAESIKFRFVGANDDGEPTFGTLILMREGQRTAGIYAIGPDSKAIVVDQLGEILANEVSLTPDRVPALRASLLAKDTEKFKAAAVENAVAEAQAAP